MEVEDLYEPLQEHKSSSLGTKISRVWQKDYDAYQKEKSELQDEKRDRKKKLKEPSLIKVLIKCFGVQIMLYGIFLAVFEILLRYKRI